MHFFQINMLYLANVQFSVLCIPKQSTKSQQVKQIRTIIAELIYFYFWSELKQN